MDINKITKRHHLTKSESTILHYVSEGYTSREIATVLGISIKTIETHRANCIKKLNLEKKRNSLLQFVIKNKH